MRGSVNLSPYDLTRQEPTLSVHYMKLWWKCQRCFVSSISTDTVRCAAPTLISSSSSSRNSSS